MSRLSNAAFVLSVIGAAYQFVAPNILIAAEPTTTNNFYYYVELGLGFPALLSLVVFWASSQLLKDPRITWPTIISVLGFANLANLIILSSIPTSSRGGILGNSFISATGLFILILPSVLVIVGGLLGIIASRKYSRQEKQTITPLATSQSKLS